LLDGLKTKARPLRLGKGIRGDSGTGKEYLDQEEGVTEGGGEGKKGQVEYFKILGMGWLLRRISSSSMEE